VRSVSQAFEGGRQHFQTPIPEHQGGNSRHPKLTGHHWRPSDSIHRPMVTAVSKFYFVRQTPTYSNVHPVYSSLCCISWYSQWLSLAAFSGFKYSNGNARCTALHTLWSNDFAPTPSVPGIRYSHGVDFRQISYLWFFLLTEMRKNRIKRNRSYKGSSTRLAVTLSLRKTVFSARYWLRQQRHLKIWPWNGVRSTGSLRIYNMSIKTKIS